MKLKYSYKKDETPEERLRNKLQPIFYLVSAVETRSEDPYLKELAAKCALDLDEVIMLLDDIPVFYQSAALMVPKDEFKQTNTLKK